jgi:hypothetical protein
VIQCIHFSHHVTNESATFPYIRMDSTRLIRLNFDKTYMNVLIWPLGGDHYSRFLHNPPWGSPMFLRCVSKRAIRSCLKIHFQNTMFSAIRIELFKAVASLQSLNNFTIAIILKTDAIYYRGFAKERSDLESSLNLSVKEMKIRKLRKGVLAVYI